MLVVFGVVALIFLVLIGVIIWGATVNRAQNYQMGPGYYDPGYIEPGVVVVDDTPLIAGMIAADIAADVATDIAFSGGQQMGGMDQGFGGDSFGGDNFGSDTGFDDSSSGFDMGGGGDF